MQLAKRTARNILLEAVDCENEDARKALVAHARRSERASALTAMLKLAESETDIPVMPNELDSHAWLLNCPNGTLNLQTGELQAHSPADLIPRSRPFRTTVERGR